MTGVLNYAAPTAAARRGMTCGIVSTCLASTVFASPIAVLAGCALVERMYGRPGPIPCNINVGLLLVVIPTLVTCSLAMLGLLFGTAGVIAQPRAGNCAIIGVMVNIGVLFSIACSVILH